MAREAKKLTARTVATLTTPGLHADGDGLYLVVDRSGAKRWSYIFQWTGKRSEMGLGRLADVSLADARELAIDARRQVRSGVNPIEARRNAIARPQSNLFGDFADELVDQLVGGFRNAKHVAQWKMTLRVYAAPIRGIELSAIDTAAVLRCIEPIWRTKPETASRVRGRIERVLDAARAKGLRFGENPARWKGHLEALLPPRQRLSRGHHRAVHYADMPALVTRLRASGAISSLALEWTILAASRTNETLGAKMSEIDVDNGVWTCPPDRMKAGREHRVPLTVRMLEILRLLEPLRGTTDLLFPGPSLKRPLSSMAMLMQLRRMNIDATVHGFRSAFRDWVGEETDFASEIAEAALAHVVGDATERAYRRGDALERRRRLMQAWADYLGGTESV